MAPKIHPPSDPTALLWAHQMKREHGFLLDRMQKLEAAISRIEGLATAAQDVQALTGAAIDKSSVAAQQAVEKVRREVSTQFEDLEARLEAIISKLDGVDSAGEDAARQRKDAFDREVELMKRVKGLEENIETYRNNMKTLGQRIDDGKVEMVQGQIEVLIRKATDAGEDRERVKETLAMLENATEALKRENETLEARVTELKADVAAKAAEAVMAVQALQRGLDDAASTRAVVADAAIEKGTQDVVAATAGNVPQSSNVPTKNARLKTSAVALKPTGTKPMKRELAGLMGDVAPRRSTRCNNKRTPNAASALLEKIDKTDQNSKNGDFTDEKIQEHIVRKGKGWVEVVEILSNNEDEEHAKQAELVPPSNAKQIQVRKSNTDSAGNPLKRGPGRPRKKVPPAVGGTSAADQVPAPAPKRGRGRPRKLAEHVSAQPSVEQADALAPKRRKIEQNDSTQPGVVVCTNGKGNKRKVDADTIDDTVHLTAPRASRIQHQTPVTVAAKRLKQETAATDGAAQAHGTLSKTKSRGRPPVASKSARRGLTNVFSSPISSPPGSLGAALSSQNSDAVVMTVKEQPASRKRTIPQNDDTPRVYGKARKSGLTGANLVNAEFDLDFEM